MSHKSTHDLEAGMKLAADVYNLDGKILFSTGAELSERQIEILMMWGVESVRIEGENGDDDQFDLSQFSQSVVRKVQAEVDERYRLAKSSHPAVQIIKKVSVLQAAKSTHSPSAES
ncbi:hypothetical protein [Pelagicoccus sp. SDUM812003]|uniref:hypothetical protein n=1 Tax=Pelagicoccus sp. SDUM812003 TaxID=3041267 RepID=UPI00280CB629|nr:hypothetical protein [Pelagicoccus sp. SDUM812003]MDQ8204558.1 hypothetical protein [Pelagicoccus sp. SDUM812003]